MLRRVVPLVCVATLSACGGSTETEPTNEPANVIVYETRGRVEFIPDPTMPMSDFLVHHEPIPGFKAKYDEATPSGMNAMVMPFPPADGVDISSVNVGDILSLRFEVEYHPTNGTVSGMSLVEFQELPVDTQLDLGRVNE